MIAILLFHIWVIVGDQYLPQLQINIASKSITNLN